MGPLADNLLSSPWAACLAAWALTYFIHSTLWLGSAWVACRWWSQGRDWLDDLLWKFALLAPLVSASLQVGLNLQPLGGVTHLPTMAKSVSPVESKPAAATLASSEPVNLNYPSTTHTTSTLANSLPTAAALSVPNVATLPHHPRAEVVVAPAEASLTYRNWLLGGWASVAGLGMLWLAARWWYGLNRLQQRSRPLTTGPVVDMLRSLCEQAEAKQHIPLYCSQEIEAPLAMEWSGPRICLPARAITSLSDDELQTVLAHELAHLLRHDPLWLMLCRVLEVVFFFQPLNWLARRRLQETAEFLCDRWAADQTGLNVALARCLTEVASWLLPHTEPLGAVAMAGRRSQLGQRVRRLLQWDSNSNPSLRIFRWLVPCMTLVLVLAIICLPSVSPGIAQLTGRAPRRPAPQAPVPAESASQSKPTHLPMLDLDPVEKESPLEINPSVAARWSEVPPPRPPQPPGDPLAQLDREMDALSAEIEEIDALLAELPEVAEQIAPAWQKLQTQLAEVQRRRLELNRRLPRSPLMFRE